MEKIVYKTAAVISILVFSFCMPCYAAENFVSVSDEFGIKQTDDKQKIELNADNVRYDEVSENVEAEGNVCVRNWQYTLNAPQVQYNNTTQVIKAVANDNNNVTVFSQGNKLTGKSLEYDIKNRRGIFTDVVGNSGELYLKGENIYFMPAGDAVNEKILSKNRVPQKSIQNKDIIAQWNNISATTCDFAKPHYKLKTKNAVIIPGNKIILKKPALYFSEHMVFKYPYDYIAKLGKHSSIMPIIDYSSEKGAGFGVQGPLDFGKHGVLDTRFVYWTKDLFEADFNYERDFFVDGLSIYGRISREYNKDDKDIQWRPQWGFKYAKNGWEGKLYFSDRELVTTEMIPGVTRRFNVTKKPETNVNTPWLFSKFKPAKLRVGAIYGRYSDDSSADWIRRVGGRAELRHNFDDIKLFRYFTPLYGARYYFYKYYDDEGKTQKIADAWAGVKYNIGAFDLTTRYYQRWVNGKSPLEFDQYRDNKLIYQSLSLPLPFGHKHNRWTASAAAEYDLVYSRFSTLYYTLSYSKHCYTWMLWGKKEFFGTESELGLTFYINAFPNTKLHVGSKLDDDERKLMEGEH